MVVPAPELSVPGPTPVLAVAEVSSAGAPVELSGAVVGVSGVVVGMTGSSGEVEVPVAAESAPAGTAGS